MSNSVEIAANVLNAASIVLAARNSLHTWWVGIVGCVLFGLVFFGTHLYADVNRGAVAAIPVRPSRATFVTAALRLMIGFTMTQGRRWRANLGLRAQTRWDSKRLRARDQRHVAYAIQTCLLSFVDCPGYSGLNAFALSLLRQDGPTRIATLCGKIEIPCFIQGLSVAKSSRVKQCKTLLPKPRRCWKRCRTSRNSAAKRSS
ncbi:MAG: nicotinamide mononucleotide transporter [Verrucomicrobia bacterium]|nr:nicotinamide mononucleotide transporter [Verrucomicrobiota bacterium]